MTELHAVVSGRVQGVAYRNFVANIARELNLVGFVSNLPDGSVEVVAQGDLTVLKVFLNHLRTGPDGSRVASVFEEMRKPSHELMSFDIV